LLVVSVDRYEWSSAFEPNCVSRYRVTIAARRCPIAQRSYDVENLIALLALTAMEIVLGIDNIVFLAIVTGRLPAEQQPNARRLGLGLALIMRILLLCTLSRILALDTPFFHLTDVGVPESWLAGEHSEQINGVSVRDLILLAGGLFLIWKSVHEIHKKLEGEEHAGESAVKTSFASAITQIVILDMIFSIDSVITAVGMARALWVMILAVILAVLVMLVFAEAISAFVHRNPTIKMLALSFLILIGVVLVAEGIGTELDRGYVYFAMAFALAVEMLNLRVRPGRVKKPAAGAV
jgi:predicted tellurium resistance membrane protein TerC